jgi:DNA topoisomerase-2
MPIYALTNERVKSLLDQKAKKQVELNEMLQLSAKDLWNSDLDDLSAAWQDLLETDITEGKDDLDKTKKGRSSKFTKVSKKRASDAGDGEFMVKKPKAAKAGAAASKTTSFSAKVASPKGTKGMHTAAFTSVNKIGSTIAKKEDIKKVSSAISIADDDEFETLIKGIRTEAKPEIVDLLSPQTAVKPKKTFTIPGVRKPSALAAPKPRAVSKTKTIKRKVESDDEDSFAFMADDRSSVPAEAGGRRPARAAATKARAIVLTSDDVFDESEESEIDVDDDEDDDEE